MVCVLALLTKLEVGSPAEKFAFGTAQEVEAMGVGPWVDWAMGGAVGAMVASVATIFGCSI